MSVPPTSEVFDRSSCISSQVLWFTSKVASVFQILLFANTGHLGQEQVLLDTVCELLMENGEAGCQYHKTKDINHNRDSLVGVKISRQLALRGTHLASSTQILVLLILGLCSFFTFMTDTMGAIHLGTCNGPIISRRYKCSHSFYS